MLEFLKNVSIDESEIIKAAKKKGTGGGVRKERNPTHPYTIRLFKNGSVYPSADLVDRFNLEYVARPVAATEVGDAEAEKTAKWIQPGGAFDVFDSAEFPAFKSPQRFILLNVTTKAAGKADLFASVTWDALTGEPENSVLEQGAKTFGISDLLGFVKEIYKVELNDETPYIDLVVLDSKGEITDAPAQPFKLVGDKKVAFIPKKVSRGDAKGSLTVVKRDDPWLFVLYPLLEVHPELTPTKEEKKAARLSVEDGVKAQGTPGAEPVSDESPFTN